MKYELRERARAYKHITYVLHLTHNDDDDDDDGNWDERFKYVN